MSTTTNETTVSASAEVGARRGLIPRLGAALALVPLGAWTVMHLWDNLYAYRGGDVWQARVASPRYPLLEVVTSAVVWLPLLMHTAWGMRRFRIMRPNLGRYPTFDNLKYVVQRLSALGLLFFLPAHVWLARLKPLIEHGRHETFADLSWHVRHHPPTLVVYTLGVLGTAYHLANGVATAGMTWGFAASPRAARRMTWLSALFFALLLAMGWGAVYLLWDAGGAQHSATRALAAR
jgi:succinate dehydrogenase / fumarate reductase cytochrome b subunit